MFIIELLIILFLIVLNGILAMSEIAILSARKVRLRQMAEEGSRGAQQALRLAESPSRFLATVQIGITMIGVLLGAVAGTTISQELAQSLAQVPALASVSGPLALTLVVLLTTYLSLVIGELVPKRLALHRAERLAATLAPAMRRLAGVTAPVVTLLSLSTDSVLRLLGVRSGSEPPVTDEEILALIEEGVRAGVFEAVEPEMVASVMELDETRVDAVMTPRVDVEWIDLDDPLEVNLEKVMASEHSQFPAAHGGLDEVAGIVRAKDLLNQSLRGQRCDFAGCLREALFIPESATAAHALALFRQSGNHLALVISEHGGIEGVVTMQDLLDEIVGTVGEPEAVQRPDGTWLLDGLLSIEELKETFDLKALPGEEEGRYQTLGGLVMAQLGRIPGVADTFECAGLRFEVMDMDGKRVDKVLVERLGGVDGGDDPAGG